MADVSVEARERMKTEYIREDRTVEGWYIETHYTPCKGIADANGYLRVLVDEEGYDTETRILHETLNGIGWVKSAALSANNQERAAGTAGPLPAAFECLDNLDQEVDGGWSEAARHDLRKLRPLLRMIEMEGLAATSTKPADEVIDMALCEAHALVLREGQPYTFRRVGDCEKCAKMSADAKEAYGEVEHVEAAKHVCTPQPPTAEPVDPAYPFYELKFIMRVLSHKGGAPKQDWDTAYGMAREIFSRWHKDRQSTAEGQTKQGRAADGAVRPALLIEAEKKSLQKFAEDVWADLQTIELGGYSGINRPFWLAWKFTEVIEKYGYRDVGLHHSKNALDEAYQRGKNEATQPPSASPVAVPEMDLDLARAMCRSAGISLVSQEFIINFAEFYQDWLKGYFALPRLAELDMKACFESWQRFDPDSATQPALPDAGLDSQKDAS